MREGSAVAGIHKRIFIAGYLAVRRESSYGWQHSHNLKAFRFSNWSILICFLRAGRHLRDT